jgi:hypothetical protein
MSAAYCQAAGMAVTSVDYRNAFPAFFTPPAQPVYFTELI